MQALRPGVAALAGLAAPGCWTSPSLVITSGGMALSDSSGLSDFVREYREALCDLTAPTKSSISALTMLAAENKAVASSIAAAIENRLITCHPDHRLPALYLLDSIAKNARDPYVLLFARNLPQVFLTANENAPPKAQASLQRLLGTWRGVFPDAPLDAIAARMAAASGNYPPPPEPQAVYPPPPMGGYAYPQQPQPQQQPVVAAYNGYAPPPQQQQMPVSAAPLGGYAQQQQQPAAYNAQGYATVPLQQQQQPAYGYNAPQQQQQQPAYGGGPAPYPQQQQPYPTQQQPYPSQQQPYATQQQQPYPTQAEPSGMGMAMPDALQQQQQGVQAAAPQELGDVSKLLSLLQTMQTAVPAMKNPPTPPPASPTPAAAAAAAAATRYPPGVFDASRIKEFDQGVVDALAAQSKQNQSKHLDRLFLHRQRVKNQAQSSRRWYVDIDNWIAGTAADSLGPVFFQSEGEAAAAAAAPAEAASVPVDDSQPCCALSGERFDQFWDRGHQEWRYRGAVRLEDEEEAARYGVAPGSLVLASCLGGSGAGDGLATDASPKDVLQPPPLQALEQQLEGAAVEAALAAAAAGEGDETNGVQGKQGHPAPKGIGGVEAGEEEGVDVKPEVPGPAAAVAAEAAVAEAVVGAAEGKRLGEGQEPVVKVKEEPPQQQQLGEGAAAALGKRPPAAEEARSIAGDEGEPQEAGEGPAAPKRLRLSE